MKLQNSMNSNLCFQKEALKKFATGYKLFCKSGTFSVFPGADQVSKNPGHSRKKTSNPI